MDPSRFDAITRNLGTVSTRRVGSVGRRARWHSWTGNRRGQKAQAQKEEREEAATSRPSSRPTPSARSWAHLPCRTAALPWRLPLHVDLLQRYRLRRWPHLSGWNVCLPRRQAPRLPWQHRVHPVLHGDGLPASRTQRRPGVPGRRVSLHRRRFSPLPGWRVRPVL